MQTCKKELVLCKTLQTIFFDYVLEVHDLIEASQFIRNKIETVAPNITK